MHNGTIIAEVTKRAKTSWHSNSVPPKEHWIATGKLWAKECREQGLEQTAVTIEKHLEWFERNSG